MANGKVVRYTIDEKTLSDLTRTLASFSAAAEALRKQVIQLFPAKYGSDLWWEQSIERSREDYKAGRYTELKTKEDIHRFFDSL